MGVIRVHLWLNSSSPNLATLVWRPHHRLAFLASIRGGELRHVRQRPIHAKPCQRMRIGRVAQTRGFRSNVLRPDLRPTQKEALLRRETVDVLWPWLTLQGLLIRGV